MGDGTRTKDTRLPRRAYIKITFKAGILESPPGRIDSLSGLLKWP